MPCASRAWTATLARTSSSFSPSIVVVHPGTISPHLNSRIGSPSLDHRIGFAGYRVTIAVNVPGSGLSGGADRSLERAVRDRQQSRPAVVQPADDEHLPEPRGVRDGRLGRPLDR